MKKYEISKTQKTAYWVKSSYAYSYYNYDCSNCGCNDYRQIGKDGKCKIMRFCPNCEFKMSVK